MTASADARAEQAPGPAPSRGRAKPSLKTPAKGVGSGTPVSLALQGGGAHGAFTWGVLDKLLEENRFCIRAISGASAGAMNGAALAAGALHRGGPDGAREQLEGFWRAVSKAGSMYNNGLIGSWANWMETMGLDRGAGQTLVEAMARLTSPYERNPLNFHPLRDILDDQIDFDSLQSQSPAALFIAAANVHTGRAHVFETPSINASVLLASACLPFLFQAVEVDGDHYWDGGYVANPALFPLMDARYARDLILVHLNPLHRQSLPTSPDGILNRLNEITFNAAFLAELRALALREELIGEHWLSGLFNPKMRRLRVHAVRADEPLANLPRNSKFDTDWAMLTELRDRGRAAAATWLGAAGAQVGRRSTVDLHKVFLDPHGPHDSW